MSGLQIKITTQGADTLAAFLKGVQDAAPKVLLQAINKTLPGVRDAIVSEVGAVITADEAVITDACTIAEATEQQITGRIEVSGNSLPLIRFTNRQAPKGIEVLVKKNRLPAVIPGSFYATTRDGSTGIFRRESLTRYPIRQLFSSSVANVAGDHIEAILNKADGLLETNLEEAFKGETGKL